MSGFIERDRYGIGQGQYSDIRREHWQPITFQAAVLVPLGQGVVIGLTWGLVATLAGAVVCNLAGWPVRFGLSFGGLAGAVLVACQAGASILWIRDAYLSREEYTTERTQGAQADKTTVTIELVDRQANNGYGQTLRDQLDASPEQLALVASAERLSKRGLMDAGMSDSQAMRLLSQLLAFGYIARQADNMPASWTNKGQALRRAFTGGGGGGGVVVDVPTTTKSIVGEG